MLKFHKVVLVIDLQASFFALKPIQEALLSIVIVLVILFSGLIVLRVLREGIRAVVSLFIMLLKCAICSELVVQILEGV